MASTTTPEVRPWSRASAPTYPPPAYQPLPPRNERQFSPREPAVSNGLPGTLGRPSPPSIPPPVTSRHIPVQTSPKRSPSPESRPQSRFRDSRCCLVLFIIIVIVVAIGLGTKFSTGDSSSDKRSLRVEKGALLRRAGESLTWTSIPNFSPTDDDINNKNILLDKQMKMEQIATAPNVSDFTPLSEHQEQTPGTFFNGQPVLHLHAIANITADREDLQRLTSPVDVYVTSRNLILYSSAASLGFQIPYPTITVTAQDGADILLELNLSDADTADEDIEFLQMRITPERIQKHGEEEQATEGAGTNGTTSSNDTSTALFKAISDCQELNPDPRGDDEDEDGEGAFDETAPGATGWITSENMADFMDENGNFRMPAGVTVVGGEEEGEATATLGAGAGTTRTATEANEEGDDEENKWQRTG